MIQSSNHNDSLHINCATIFRCVRHLSEDDRNPEPPVELFTDHPELIQADTIGDTAFSRQWLFSTLMALIKVMFFSRTATVSKF